MADRIHRSWSPITPHEMRRAAAGAAMLFTVLIAIPSFADVPQTFPFTAPVVPGSQVPTPVPVPMLGGFAIDLSISDSTGLNGIYYANSAGLLVLPTWGLGRLLFRDTPFESMVLEGRWSLNRSFAGYDPASVIPENNHGPATPCSNLVPDNAGNIVANNQTVQRCNYPNTYQFEPGDFAITLANPGIYKIPKAGIKINPAIRYTIPLSYQSQYATTLAVLQGSIGISRSFWGDRLSVSYSFAATKFFNRYTTPLIQAVSGDLSGLVTPQYRASDIASNNAAFYAAISDESPPGGFNTSFSITDSVLVSLHPFKRFRLNAFYVLTDSFAYPANCSSGNFGGVITNPCANANAVAISTGWAQGVAGRDIRDGQVFIISSTYEINDWLAVFASWVTASPLRMPDNHLYQPFISVDANAFTNVNLGLTVALGAIDDSK